MATLVDPQVDPKGDRRTFPRCASTRFYRCRWSGRYVGPALFAALIATLGSAGSAFADGPERARAEIRILGRLDTRPHVMREAERTTIVGVLSDEAGVPVAGAVRLLSEAPASWKSCLENAKVVSRTAEVPVDASGRYCLRGPALPQNTQARLRLSGPNHQAREVEISIDPKPGGRPKIAASPEVLDLDDEAGFVVEATAEGGALSDGEPAELQLECHGTRTSLARTQAKGGLFRFTAEAKDLPGPDSCAFIVRSSVDSSPRPVVLLGRASLSSTGWTEQDGRHRAVIRVQVRWQTHTRPLTVGVLEGHDGQNHQFTVPLSDAGEGVLEVDAAPAKALSIRLAQAPPYAKPAEVLTLPARAPWQGWPVLEAAGLLALGAFLLLSWLGGEGKRPREPGESPRARLPALGGRTQVTGRAVDTHTGRPIVASIELLALGTTKKDLLESTSSDGQGHFSFQVREPGLTRLRLTADGYVAFEGPLPPGEPTIRLTERRRAALSLLTSWVRAQSATAPIPTPGEVHRQAEASGRPSLARWAADLGAAAYGRASPTDDDLSALAERKPS